MRLLVFGSSILFAVQIWGLDSSSAILLNGKTSANLQDEALTSGRYSIKESSEALTSVFAKPVRRVSKKNRNPANEVVATPTPSPVAVESSGDNEKMIQVPSYAEQVKDLMLGKALPELDAYREQIHPDDIRLNRVEINVAPGMIYVDSKSTESYRNYTSFSPFLKIGAEIWWTPFIGLYGNYATSVGADVKNGNQLQSNSSVTHELIDGGLDFRQFFGFSRRANSIAFGLHYFETKFSPPSDSSSRTKTKTSGFGIHFQSRFPVAPSYAWILGASIDPRVTHSEFGTSLGLQSGGGTESSRFAVHFGGEFKLSRQNQMTWDLSYSLERNQFSGSANLTDPETARIPSGVSVTNSTSLLTIGYRWGH